MIIDEKVLQRVADLLEFPRTWGRFLKGKGWLRKKIYQTDGTEIFSIIQADGYIRIINKLNLPFQVCVSEYDQKSDTHTNMQRFIVFDVDNGTDITLSKPPTQEIHDELLSGKYDITDDTTDEEESYNIKSLITWTCGKGYRVWIFLTAPVHSDDCLMFQETILKSIGCVEVSIGVWKHNNGTLIETMTNLGDGSMTRVPYSLHPKKNLPELPLTPKNFRKHDPKIMTVTDKEILDSYIAIQSQHKTYYKKILNIGVGKDAKAKRRKSGKKNRGRKTSYTTFTIPPKSQIMDDKVGEMLDRIFAVPCLEKCLSEAMDKSTVFGKFYARVNLAITLSAIGFTQEEIAYLVREQINDAEDNLDLAQTTYQVHYWSERSYHSRCEIYQDTRSPKFCCEDCCGRLFPHDPEPNPDYVTLTPPRDFAVSYDRCEDIINDPASRMLVRKTTRAGFTTAMQVRGVAMGKKVAFVVPRTSISEQTFAQAIQLAAIGDPKHGPVSINGLVMSSNIKRCLIRAQEAHDYKIRMGKDITIDCPIPREQCSRCPYDGTIVIPPTGEPLYTSDVQAGACMLSTYRGQHGNFDAINITYAMLQVLKENSSVCDVSKRLLDDVLTSDIIVLDEISQFIDSSAIEVLVYSEPWDDDKGSWNVVNGSDRQLNAMIRWGKPGNKQIDYIGDLLDDFATHFRDTTTYQHGQVIQNFLSLVDRQKLRLDLIIYLNILWKFHIQTGHRIKEIWDIINILTAEQWYVSKVATMEWKERVSFIVPQSNKEMADWLKQYDGKLIITDATLPYTSVSTYYPNIAEYDFGDPMETARSQLVIADWINITEKEIIHKPEVQTRLKRYAEDIIDLHGADKVMVLCPNKLMMKKMVAMELGIPDDNITYYRSNKTIGVASELRVMLAVCAPYAPIEAFDWISLDLVGNTTLSKPIWTVNTKNTYFQSISRSKDPEGKSRSIVYAFGINDNKARELVDGCIGTPFITRAPRMKQNVGSHTSIGRAWLSQNRILREDEARIITMFRNGFDDEAVAKKMRIGVAKVKKILDEYGR